MPGALTLRAVSTAWATQMKLLTSVLMGRLDEQVGAGTVTEIVVTGPEVTPLGPRAAVAHPDGALVHLRPDFLDCSR